MSFLDGMSEQRATVTLLALIDEIGLNLNRRELRDSRTTLINFVGTPDSHLEQQSPVHDPAVMALLRFIGIDDSTAACSLADEFSNHEFGNLGANWAALKSADTKDLTLSKAINNYGDESLKWFINKVCNKPFCEILNEAVSDLNFVDSESSANLYTVSLNGNYMSLTANDEQAYLTRKCLYDDVFATFSLQGLFINPLECMTFKMNKLANTQCEFFKVPELSKTVFTKINILSNGLRILEIPLVYDLDLKCGWDMQVARRAALNAKGLGAYRLDFDCMEITKAATTQDLREIARYLPKVAATKVRGAALEDALGM